MLQSPLSERDEIVSLIVLLFAFLFPPCQAEDSMNCVWDVGVAGNGAGTSFVDVAGIAYSFDGKVF